MKFWRIYSNWLVVSINHKLSAPLQNIANVPCFLKDRIDAVISWNVFNLLDTKIYNFC